MDATTISLTPAQAKAWEAMSEATLAHVAETFGRVRAATSDKFSKARDAQSGPLADQVCAYRQRDHWAFLQILTEMTCFDRGLVAMLKQLCARVSDLEDLTAKSAAGISYRGVWREGGEYRQGDMTTWSGSLWHCDTERTVSKPGAGQDWTLAVKRGRDGKDATP